MSAMGCLQIFLLLNYNCTYNNVYSSILLSHVCGSLFLGLTFNSVSHLYACWFSPHHWEFILFCSCFNFCAFCSIRVICVGYIMCDFIPLFVIVLYLCSKLCHPFRCALGVPISLVVTGVSFLQTRVRKSAPSRAQSPGYRTVPSSTPRSRSPTTVASVPSPPHRTPFSARLSHQVLKNTGNRPGSSSHLSWVGAFKTCFKCTCSFQTISPPCVSSFSQPCLTLGL